MKRQIRQECGSGCVVCGSIFYEYHHFDPAFEDALEHDPAGIALLCGTHHRRGDGARLLSVETIRRHRANPRARQKGFSFGALDAPLGGEFGVWLGDLPFFGSRSILRVHGEELLRVDPPDAPNEPLRITATFYDVGGRVMFRVRENEVQDDPERNQIEAPTDNWDTELSGNTFRVRRRPGDVALEFTSLPPNGLRISRLRMKYRGSEVLIENGSVSFQHREARVRAEATTFQDCEVCVSINEHGIGLGAEASPALTRLAGAFQMVGCSINGGVVVEGDVEMHGLAVIGRR